MMREREKEFGALFYPDKWSSGGDCQALSAVAVAETDGNWNASGGWQCSLETLESPRECYRTPHASCEHTSNKALPKTTTILLMLGCKNVIFANYQSTCGVLSDVYVSFECKSLVYDALNSSKVQAPLKAKIHFLRWVGMYLL